MCTEKNEPLRDKNGLTESEFLAAYKPGNYPHPSVTADILIFSLKENHTPQLLMIKRGGHPCLGMWALPGGFVNPDENTDHAAARELFEETSLEGIYLNQLAVFSDPGRDKRTWIITCAYTAFADRDRLKPDAGDDADNTGWFDVKFILDGEKGKIELENKESNINISAELCIKETKTVYGSSYDIAQLKSHGIAFDHAKIIATAFLDMRYGRYLK